MLNFTGRRLGKYTLVERLGRGGAADVYKAYQPGLERFVAIKVLHGHLAESPDFVTRFQREAKIVSRLRHPNIVQVIDFDMEGEVYFMVMEYIHGGTLKAYLSQHRRLSVNEALRLIAQLTDAMEYAHRNGMIHRDIKPGNVLFADEQHSHPVLTDFGIARLLGGTTLTGTGVYVGTPAYMSPEAGRGERIDERGDIYSMGVVLYEMLAGLVPFNADTPYAVIMKHVNEPLPPPSTFQVQLPTQVEWLLFKALAKDPSERFQNATELAHALAQIQTELPQEQAHAFSGAFSPPIAPPVTGSNTPAFEDPLIWPQVAHTPTPQTVKVDTLFPARSEDGAMETPVLTTQRPRRRRRLLAVLLLLFIAFGALGALAVLAGNANVVGQPGTSAPGETPQAQLQITKTITPTLQTTHTNTPATITLTMETSTQAVTATPTHPPTSRPTNTLAPTATRIPPSNTPVPPTNPPPRPTDTPQPPPPTNPPPTDAPILPLPTLPPILPTVSSILPGL